MIHRSEGANGLYDSPEDTTGGTQTAIQNRYCFWYKQKGNKQLTTEDYESSIKQLASFQTVEHFWRIYNHLQRPDQVPIGTDYHLFKDGIKPAWEDSHNARGGLWMMRLKKGLASRQELLLAMIGEQFDVGNEICGAVMSVRYSEDVVYVWNRNADNREAADKIRDQIRRILKLPNFVQLEYRRHQDSMSGLAGGSQGGPGGGGNQGQQPGVFRGGSWSRGPGGAGSQR
ncbi:putative eukaryotic initiation factor 4E [Tribonema minus]|uniref:Putative eukaryotic initiation factor 4E n=1 Tax=Tribonema minus TaxID=303371 RepID=A0A835Z354_9STRA|nr:putative eukaryotic initiation factor 4E [Tribonema minus]